MYGEVIYSLEEVYESRSGRGSSKRRSRCHRQAGSGIDRAIYAVQKNVN